MNGVLADWKQKRAFDLLEDLEHMFGTEALENSGGFYGSRLRQAAGKRIFESCDISSHCTVTRLISAYCDDKNCYFYREIRNYPNRMGGKFKKEVTNDA